MCSRLSGMEKHEDSLLPGPPRRSQVRSLRPEATPLYGPTRRERFAELLWSLCILRYPTPYAATLIYGNCSRSLMRSESEPRANEISPGKSWKGAFRDEPGEPEAA